MFTILIMAFGKAIGTDVLSLAAVFSQKIVFGLTARSDIFGLSLFEEPYLWIQQTYCNTLKMLWTPKITFGKFFNKYWPKKKKKLYNFGAVLNISDIFGSSGLKYPYLWI